MSRLSSKRRGASRRRRWNGHAFLAAPPMPAGWIEALAMADVAAAEDMVSWRPRHVPVVISGIEET